MSFRRIKQIIYFFLYLVLIFTFAYGMYLWAAKPAPSCFDGKKNQGEERVDCGGPCQSCALKAVEALRALPAVLIPTPDGNSATLISQFRNPNSGFGARSFDYSISLFGSQGELVERIEGSSFIYAGQLKFLIRPNLSLLADRIKSSEISISNLDWVSREEFPQPQTGLRDISLEISEEKIDRREAIVRGVLRNENPYSLSQAFVSARIVNELGATIAVSQTLLRDIAPFSEEEFVIILPIGEDEEDLQDPIVNVEVLR